MKKPLLCSLGFHKWRNYGSKVEVFWKEPTYGKTMKGGPDLLYERHGKTVYERKECKRCGMKLRCKFITNSDGTLSCVGWEPDTEETDKGDR